MNCGTFSGNPKTEWLCGGGNDRAMRLLADFWYIDPAGRRWLAPEGSVIDGASIPQTLWSSVGSPYTGEYRRASIVHDVACDTPHGVRTDGDTMFYFACLCGGCSPLQAKLLYAGVRIGSWVSEQPVLTLELAPDAAPGERLPGQQTENELAVRARFTLLSGELRASGDDFDDIRAIVDRHLAAATPP
ncbi:MAG: DUF1353 domain-containing protein [Pseudomonadota bacterium]